MIQKITGLSSRLSAQENSHHDTSSASAHDSVSKKRRNLPKHSSKSITKEISDIYDNKIPGMVWDLETMYGLSYKEAAAYGDNPFIRIGFDGKENRLGWTVPHYEEVLRQHSEGGLSEVAKEIEHIRKRFKYVIFCGVGGYGLGVQLAVSAFGQPDDMKIYSLRSADPGSIKDIFDSIRSSEMNDLEYALYKTCVVIVSKSGQTNEVQSVLQYFEDLYHGRGVNPRKHIVFLSDKGSSLESEAERKRYLFKTIQLNGASDIPGRFAAPVTRAFLWPLALIRPELTQSFLQKAVNMNDRYYDETFIKLGVFLHVMAHTYNRDKITFLVTQEMRHFPDWVDPVFEESLGQQGSGLTVLADDAMEIADLRGADDCDRVYIEIRVDGKSVNPTLVSHLKRRGYPLWTIDLNGVDELGGLMLGFQRVVATMAFLADVNFVNQNVGNSFKEHIRRIFVGMDEAKRPVMPKQWRFAGYEDIKVYYTPFIEAGIATMDELRYEVQRLGGDFFNAACVYAAMIKLADQKSRTNPVKGTFEVAKLVYFGQCTDGFKEVLDDARYNVFTRLLQVPSKQTEMADVQHGSWGNLAEGRPMFFNTFILPMDCEQPDFLSVDVENAQVRMVEMVQDLARRGRKVVLLTIDRNVADSEDMVQEFFEDVEKYLRQSYSDRDTGRVSFRTNLERGGQVMVRHVVLEPISRFMLGRKVSLLRHRQAVGLL